MLEAHGYDVTSTDLVYRGYGKGKSVDFLNDDFSTTYQTDIITNPPYKYAKEFVERSIDLINDGHKVAMLLKLTFLEGKARRQMFKKYPPKTVYVFSERVKCAKNGDFESIGGSAVCYAWFVWVKGYKGDTIVKWI